MCPLFSKHPSTFVQGGAGGENVVHQEDRPLADGRPVRHSERSLDIPAPLSAGEPRLDRCGPMSDEDPFHQRDLRPATQVPGQQTGLVEAPFLPASLVERHRHDHVRRPVPIVLFPKRVDQAGQRTRQAGMGAVLELVDDRLERVLQPAVGSGEIEVEVPSSAGCAQGPIGRKIAGSKGVAAQVAKNSVQSGNTLPAGPTNDPAPQGFHRALTDHASGGRQN